MHVRVHKSKWFIQISTHCYYSGKYSLQGFVTASNVYICQHSNCYCQKDTKIFYKLSNNKSASLIWVYFILHRRWKLLGPILRSSLRQNFIWLQHLQVKRSLCPWEWLDWARRDEENALGKKHRFSDAGSSAKYLVSIRAEVTDNETVLRFTCSRCSVVLWFVMSKCLSYVLIST